MLSRRVLRCVPLLPLLLAAQSPDVLAQVSAAAIEFPSSQGQKLHFPSIPNAGKISGQLYRGAQPRPGGLEELKKLGITTIVDLRGEDASLRNREKQEAESLGLRFVAIPVSGWSPPTSEQVAEFLSLFRSSAQEKVFVHCRFGEDRTGVFVASYRMALQGWSPRRALHEMYFFGFNGFWHPAMRTFVRDFPRRLKESPALAAFREGMSSPQPTDP
jgi:protein tyrosine phosphatase (PTP) superfamily phosphohydrolase (DUF442 family)